MLADIIVILVVVSATRCQKAIDYAGQASPVLTGGIDRGAYQPTCDIRCIVLSRQGGKDSVRFQCILYSVGFAISIGHFHHLGECPRFSIMVALYIRY
jgi:hypothetical protein